MGFFDTFFRKSNTQQTSSTPSPQAAADTRLALPRELLATGKKAEALTEYEKIVTSSDLTPEVLTAISADLGNASLLEEMTALIAPVYDPQLHAHATGINLLQAYLKLKNAAAADLLLEVLFALGKPELEERLLGFRTALEDLRASGETSEGDVVSRSPEKAAVEIKLATISRPIWSYGAPSGQNFLPEKSAAAVAIALMPFGVKGTDRSKNSAAARIATALPLALAEACSQSPRYRPLAAEGVSSEGLLFVPRSIIPAGQLMRLFGSGENQCRYAISGLITTSQESLQINVHIWDLRRGREMKVLKFSGPAALPQLFQTVLTYLEIFPLPENPLRYELPKNLSQHLESLELLLRLFLIEKNVLPAAALESATQRIDSLAAYTQSDSTQLLPRLIFQAAAAHARQLGITLSEETESVLRSLPAA